MSRKLFDPFSLQAGLRCAEMCVQNVQNLGAVWISVRVPASCSQPCSANMR